MTLFRMRFEGTLETAKKDITIHNDKNFSCVSLLYTLYTRHFFVIKSPEKPNSGQLKIKNSLNKGKYDLAQFKLILLKI